MSSAKRRHHYVPRFYLKAFATDADLKEPKQITLYNLQRGRVIPNASLREQCYAHRLYGKDDVLENALGRVEGSAAGTIMRVRAS